MTRLGNRIPSYSTAMAPYYVEIARRQFHSDSNPVNAWFAYFVARKEGFEIPDWVLNYLDEAAFDLLDAGFQAKRKNLAAATIADAMRLNGKGRGTAFARFATILRTMDYGGQVADRIAAGDKEDFAIEAVSNLEGKSYSTVYRVWKKFDKLFPERARGEPAWRPPDDMHFQQLEKLGFDLS